MAVGSNLTNLQLYLAIGVLVLANAAMFGLLFACINAKFEALDRRFEAMNHCFDVVDQPFDDMRGLWLAERHRIRICSCISRRNAFT